jgi:uncharacterized protein (TIGR03437 family)
MNNCLHSVVRSALLFTCLFLASSTLGIAQSFIIATVAGNGANGYSGDGGPAISAHITSPAGLTIDSFGNVYIADAANERIRKVSPNGTITTVAGNGIAGYSGDGGPATSAALQITSFGQAASAVVVDSVGNLYIADSWNNRVRKVSANGVIATIAGTGGGGYAGDGGPATIAQIGNPAGLALDSAGNLYISHYTAFDCVVRKVVPTGVITTVAGTSNCGYSGDGGPATNALLNRPEGLALDSTGNLYIADTDNQRIRKVAPNGIITTVAGTGNYRYDGDGGPATSFSLNYPYGVALDGAGNLYIADANNYRIREVSALGTITTVAGNGDYGFGGDGGSATSAKITQPDAIAINSAGNLYVSDLDNNRVRRLTAIPAGATPASQPIVFVHGFCDTADSWNTLEQQVIGYLTATSTQDAKSYPDKTPHTLYYDGSAVLQYPGGADLASNPIPTTARFFAIDFYAPGAFGSGNNGPIDTSAVAQVPIVNKANELAGVIQAITTITKTPDVIVVAHSMGGLVARAYMQGLAATAYAQNVTKLITLDTPHSGATTASDPIFLEQVNRVFPSCQLASSVNLAELAPTSSFMDLLYHTANALPAKSTVAAIESYTSPGLIPLDSGPDDGVVMQSEQSFVNSIAGATPPSSTYYDLANPFQSFPSNCSVSLPWPMLHVLSCLGAQSQTWVLVEAEIQKVLTGVVGADVPAIAAVVNAFGAGQTISPNSWVTITGTKLAPDERTWQGSDFLDQRMPTSLDGVSVTMNGESAYLYYISSSQLNILTPPDLESGDVQVLVSNNGTVSAPYTVHIQQYSPSFFTFDGVHVTATHADGSLIGPTTLYPGLSTPAKPNETIVLYANGFGPTLNPVTNSAETQSGNLPSLPTVTIAGIAASVQFAGLVSPGTYQFNVVVPASAPTGVDSLSARYASLTTQAGVELAVNSPATSPQISEYDVSAVSFTPTGITTGPDGAFWFTETGGTGKVGRIATNGTVTGYPVPTTPSYPAIITGPDGTLWFTEFFGNKIGRVTTIGSVTEYPVPTSSAGPNGIARGSDGALWFTEVFAGNHIGRITTAGAVTEYLIPTSGSKPYSICAGPDGALWFTESGTGKIGRITTSGAFSEFVLPTANSSPGAISLGPDGALWFTEANKIGRISTAGTITEYSIPTIGSSPTDITVGPDGALWFTENGANQIGRVTTDGIISEYQVPTASSGVWGIVAGPDGALWFTESNAGKIGRVSL